MTVSKSSSGMKQSVKMKALMKLGGLANKIGRRINMGPNAPSAFNSIFGLWGDLKYSRISPE